MRDALTAAFVSNPGLDAERARQRADEETIRQEWAKALPNLSLDAHTGGERTKTNSASQTTKLQPDGYNLTLTQPLFRGFQTVNGTKRAKSEVLAGAAQLQEREQTVLLDAVTAYMDVVQDRKIVKLRRDNVSFLRDELKATKARHRGGDLSKTDVAQARTRLFEGEADLAQAQADVEASEATFEAIIGRSPGALGTPHVPVNLLPPTLEAALRAGESTNPTVLAALHSQEAARRAKREAYGALLPTVSLELSHGVDNDSSLTIEKEEESSLFVRMKMPLYQGGDTRSRIRQSRARESGAAHEVADSRRRARANVIDAWKQYHAAKARIRAARQQVDAARDALKGVQIEVEVGERALFEVLDAQRELVNGEVALARAERDHVVTSYSLLAATGNLTARFLRLPAPYPDLDDEVKRKNPRVYYANSGRKRRAARQSRNARPAHLAAPAAKPAQVTHRAIAENPAGPPPPLQNPRRTAIAAAPAVRPAPSQKATPAPAVPNPLASLRSSLPAD